MENSTPTYRITNCKVRKRKGIPHVGIFQDGVVRGLWQGFDANRAAALVAELQGASPAGRLSIMDAMAAETAQNLGR